MVVIIVVTFLFYLFAWLAGYWLHENRGLALSSKTYTVKKLFPWILGYVSTAIMIGQTNNGLMLECGVKIAWLLYFVYFAIMSLLYRALMCFAKNFAAYTDDEINCSTDSYFVWIRKRNEEKKLFYEFYTEPTKVFDVDLFGSYVAVFFISTVMVIFAVLAK